MPAARIAAILVASSIVASSIMAAPAVAAPIAKPAAFAICGVCHKAEKGAPNGIGPNLWGIGGTKAGALPGYSFSPAMKAAGIVWTKPTLLAYIQAPQKVVPGTKMTFAGLKDPKAAAAVTDYLLSLK